jgi:hypothetical protein
MKILLEAPLNSLSFGNVSLNIIKELINKKHDFAIWPMNQDVDISAFDLDLETKSAIQEALNRRYDFLSADIPSLKLWHINGAEDRKNEKQYLYTFYECSDPTYVEKKIVASQSECIFSSSYSANQFNKPFVPVGFDKDFKLTNKSYLEGVVHFGLMGKFEKRKHTAKIINCWAKKYGNNNKYQLSCLINNAFLSKEDISNQINIALEGVKYTNINFIPFLKTNKDVNEFINAVDIDLTGMSGGEGWNLPSFNSTCLGKWSVVLNATSHKDWANKDNSILIEPESKIDCYDNKFFVKGQNFNQGQFFDFSTESLLSGMEEAEKKVGQVNTEGQKLADKFTYSNTVDSLLSHIS